MAKIRLGNGSALALAINEINSQYGVDVTIIGKAKSIHKYGHIESSANSTWETVQTDGGTETLLTANSITVLESTSASDTQLVHVEGHYLDASGNLVFHAQSATMTGVTAVTLSQPLARCSRLHSEAVYTVGRVTARAGAAGTVYNEVAAVHVQSEKGATSTSYRDFFIITEFGASVVGGNNASADFELEHREGNEQWHPLALFGLKGDNTTYERTTAPHRVLGPNGEIRMRCKASAAGTSVDAHFSGYLAINKAYINDASPAPA